MRAAAVALPTRSTPSADGGDTYVLRGRRIPPCRVRVHRCRAANPHAPGARPDPEDAETRQISASGNPPGNSAAMQDAIGGKHRVRGNRRCIAQLLVEWCERLVGFGKKLLETVDHKITLLECVNAIFGAEH